MPDLAQQFGDTTIDEPVSETILRDLRLVGRRLLMVVMPAISRSEMRAELRDWDLWGPFFLCMSLAVTLSLTAHDEASVVFSVIFVIVWIGAAVITLNGQLLGGKLSFFQSVCLLGYCIFPILLSALACFAINTFLSHGLAVIIRFVVVLVALFWSLWGEYFCSRLSLFLMRHFFFFLITLAYLLTKLLCSCTFMFLFPESTEASSSFLTDARFPEGRKLLALYPVLLFYLSLAWIVLIGFQQGTASNTGVTSESDPNNTRSLISGESLISEPNSQHPVSLW